ncbi:MULTISPECIES: FCD domain-containing protein [Comamonas]|uniref:GntR family transcriptional regulator n=1 Tax=Comamonas TaxID=283 RepID=UPI0012C670DE|nr:MULTISPECIES: FCD domain-containing protein [Comamonas]MPT11225.1 FCD domain-containing protein [Comamonas sp.]WKL18632.1 FCD domain-containing protein [Comamonas testosteroni]WQD45839.1 FCD domain-containing protein [Comamonas testosteroni]
MHKIKNMYKKDAPTKAPTLIDQAFAQLRQDVLNGTYGAGVKLKLDELQTAYGFSSSPLREALSRLAQEGLIRADERRGFRVTAISADDLADITRMRIMLDSQALRESIAYGDDAWEASVVGAFHRLEKVESRLSDGPVVLDQGWTDMHTAFHMALLSATPSERLRTLSASLFDQAERYRRYSARFRKTFKHKSNEHRKLMDATLRRDADTACALLEEHILSTQRNVLEVLEKVEKQPS